MNQSHKQNILLIGFGAQGQAWAMNLRDSGCSVDVYLRQDSQSFEMAKKLDFSIVSKESVDFKKYDFILLLIPDDAHENFLNDHSQKLSGSSIIYAHGFSVHFEVLQKKYPNINHILLAPKAIASEVRFNYECHRPLAAAISYEHIEEHKKQEIISTTERLSKNLGITNILKSSFKEETTADLFSEQAILCSLIPFGAKLAFEKMLEKGISKELAYIECWHEVKLIATAMIDKGPTEFFNLISPNALVGGKKASEVIFNDKYLKILDDMFSDIESSKFFHDLKDINFQNERFKVLNELKSHPLQQVYEEFGRKIK